MANEQDRKPAPVPENNARPEGIQIVGLQLLAGHGAFPHGSSSLMVGEHLSSLDASGIVREIILTADGNARIGLGPHEKPDHISDWFVYSGPFFSRVKKARR
ncbi:MAG: hypothetical protein EPO32_14595 [Anaerolineae bacterium]|nr:MAG: hypothetical protein EPO32_14595 [Anaerolineae bacterium]